MGHPVQSMFFADLARPRGLRRQLGSDPREPRRSAVRLRPHAARARALPDDGAPLAQLHRQLEDHREGELRVRGARHRLHSKGGGDHQAVRQPPRADQLEVLKVICICSFSTL